jgi:CheY-like chemotaxis protein
MIDTTNAHIPTIVYVEDSTGDAMLLEEALRLRGHAVRLQIFESGVKALHYFRIKQDARNVPPPHCILLDAQLPDLTGAQLLRFIRGSQVYDDTPVYIFAPQTGEYRDIIQSGIVSKESFIKKAISWVQFLELADLLMSSASAKDENAVADAVDSRPEVHAHGALRRDESRKS